VKAEDRAQRYGHRAALVLLCGGRHVGKSFLARKLESLLVAEGRHAYLLDGENLRHGLDADLTDTEQADVAEQARRYGEVARLLTDAGMIVVSTTNPFGLAYKQAAQTIRTLVHPVALVAVHMSNSPEEAIPEADLNFAGPKDFDEAARRIIEELKKRGVLMQTPGKPSGIQFSI
jgi:bifunctional enzyme CysN/CysC